MFVLARMCWIGNVAYREVLQLFEYFAKRSTVVMLPAFGDGREVDILPVWFVRSQKRHKG